MFRIGVDELLMRPNGLQSLAVLMRTDASIFSPHIIGRICSSQLRLGELVLYLYTRGVGLLAFSIQLLAQDCQLDLPVIFQPSAPAT